MKEDELKIQKLWRYLKIQDEHLIIRVSDHKNQTEDLLVVYRLPEDGLAYNRIKWSKDCHGDSPIGWLMSYGKPFRLIQQRNENGDFVIPDVDEWIAEQESDY